MCSKVISFKLNVLFFNVLVRFITFLDTLYVLECMDCITFLSRQVFVKNTY